MFTRDATQTVHLIDEMHRYIPPLLPWRGYDVGMVKVNHRKRQHEETKHLWQRLRKDFFDLLNVWLWQKYSGRPLHIFGSLGIISGGFGYAGGMYAVYLKTFEGMSLSYTAYPLFAVLNCLPVIKIFISGVL